MSLPSLQRGNMDIPEIPQGYVVELDSEGQIKHNPNMLVSTWALLTPMRQFVIDKVKAPLRKAIEEAKTLSDIAEELFSAIKKIPLITKRNTCFINTHILIDKKEMFLKYHYNPNRGKLCEAAFNMFIFEYEHDGYCAFLADWLLIEFAMEMAKGNWKPRFTKFPMKAGRATPDSRLEGWTGPDLPDVETIRLKMREALEKPIPTRPTIYLDIVKGGKVI